ncbi:hypothetical protein GGH12_005068 [Coemansia sp. RSA 1822]|nr:hypothetical protein LPJ76_004758 [Coemansia sp. RSA 638]KAJ2125812.1 hypothetical protein IW147_000583 [Coemansia sp. RSA 720]KAJ2540113.1 hypothetical protein GGF49_004710 [Coemansia sp. RSA 1853]KAJ2560136.1 hypothetical protein GGH12_005068 [Coemansia sp. RSA 1822]
MILPKFSVRQDDDRVYVTIHVAHVRTQTIELDIDGDQLKFSASPYYLRLTFPGKVIEDEDSNAKFDAGTGDILVTLSKQTPGEHFENLDLLTSLLATRREQENVATNGVARPMIEEIGGTVDNSDEGIDELLERARIDEDFDWEMPQQLELGELQVGSAKYGFNQQYTGYLTHVHSTANEINEVVDPDHSTPDTRRQHRIACENAKFDQEYYMENYLNDEDIQPLIKHQLSNDTLSDPEFTATEQQTMVNLPSKTLLISNKQAVYLGMVDLLFAYSLELRSHLGELTVESAWAIGAISSTLSNLEQFSSLRETCVAGYRRGLAYTLYRHWDLCERAFDDVRVICQNGRRAILKVFLELKRVFDEHDVYYVYSKLFLDDYCVWLQVGASDQVVKSLADKLAQLDVEQEEVGWDLDALEDRVLMSSDSEAEDEAEEKEQEQEEQNEEPTRRPLIEIL